MKGWIGLVQQISVSGQITRTDINPEKAVNGSTEMVDQTLLRMCD